MGRAVAVAVLVVLAAWSACAAAWFHQKGQSLYYGDAEAHLNIARRVIDSRTPGLDQLGTVWLPLPHLLMLPLVARDNFWHSGLAGVVSSAVSFVIAGTFLFAAARRVFGSAAAGATATALLALNPNLLYLQSTPMNEPVFLATFLALLYFTVLFRQKQSLWAAAAAGVAALAGSLTRYEGWFLIPPAALFFLIAGKRRRVAAAVLFAAIAALGPLAWLACNRFYFADALAFYRGPYSARAIQGNVPYPGKGDWMQAALYYRTAVVWCTGQALRWLAAAGVLVAVWRRAWWPLLLLVLPGVFYLCSIHSAGTPIFVPNLWPHSYYNTRYGMALLPFGAFAAAALVTVAPQRWSAPAALVVVAAATAPWLVHPHEDAWITWKEAQVNSEARRAWTRQAADFLAPRYRSGDGIITSFGDLTGIYRAMGVPLRETLTGDNGPPWLGAVARPDLFLRERWAVVTGGDPVQTAINRARRRGPNYELAKTIIVKGAPVIEIYHRELLPEIDEDTVYQSARRPE